MLPCNQEGYIPREIEKIEKEKDHPDSQHFSLTIMKTPILQSGSPKQRLTRGWKLT